jgi:sRNA-binding carbon storage regulator CsrA
MLVLSRKKEESIRCVVPPSDKPTVIDIKMIEIKPGRARFGLDAPVSTVITRHELLEPETTEVPAEATAPTETPSKAPADAVVPEAV